MVDVELGRVFGGFLHGVARLALGADEDDPSAVLDEVHQDGVSLVNGPHGVLEIDDVNPVAGAEYKAPHAGIPALGFVSEMDAGAEEFAHLYEGQAVTRSFCTSATVIPIGEDRLWPAGPAGQVACLMDRPVAVR